MADPYAAFKDADPYAQFSDAPRSQSAATPAPVYDANLFRQRVGRDPSPSELANFKQFKGEGFANDPNQGRYTLGQAAVGGGEGALNLGTGALASIPAAAAYLYGAVAPGRDSLSSAQATSHALTYQPRTAAGKGAVETIGQIASGPTETAARVADLLDMSGNSGSTVREVAQRLGYVAPLFGGLKMGAPLAQRFGNRVVNSMADPETAVARTAPMGSPQSISAAAAAPALANASPELQQAISTATQKTGGAVNPDILNRHLQADSLPVKMQLTEGQASQDPTLLSQEQNLRGKYKPLADRMNAQNQQLIDNLQALRDQIGPDVFTADPEGHADTLIQAYQEKDKAVRAAIDNAYDSARQSLPATAPVLNAGKLLGDVNSVLQDKWATESAPTDIMKRLQTVADGNGVITAGQFEGLRSRLAELARSNDGSTRYAAHLIRGVVEDSDLMPGTEAFKAPFDEARSLARARFQALEADPAYSAAVNESVPPNRYINRFVISAPREDVATMRTNLADSPAAVQTMGVAALEKLRDAARIRSNWTGNFAQDGYNRALQNLSPKIRALVGTGTAEKLDDLGDVARYTQSQPRGSFVNNSNTAVAQMANYGAGALEGAVNVAAHGVPVGTWGRTALNHVATGRMVKQSLAPGAGLMRLNTAAGPRPAGAASVGLMGLQQPSGGGLLGNP